MAMILVDSREQRWAHVKAYFEGEKQPYSVCKLWCGDYVLANNQCITIDRKANLQEVCGNLTHQHVRFREECVRAQNAGIRLIVLIEHGRSMKTLDDVRAWENPRLAQSPRATTGGQLAAIMESMTDKYGVEWAFCVKQQTGREICRILGV